MSSGLTGSRVNLAAKALEQARQDDNGAPRIERGLYQRGNQLAEQRRAWFANDIRHQQPTDQPETRQRIANEVAANSLGDAVDPVEQDERDATGDRQGGRDDDVAGGPGACLNR